MQYSGKMENLPHLHHIIQTVEDVFPCFLRLDAHFCLVLCRRLQEEKHSGGLLEVGAQRLFILEMTHFEPPEGVAGVGPPVEKAAAFGPGTE